MKITITKEGIAAAASTILAIKNAIDKQKAIDNK